MTLPPHARAPDKTDYLIALAVGVCALAAMVSLIAAENRLKQR